MAILQLLKLVWAVLRFRLDRWLLPKGCCPSWWLGWLLPSCDTDRGETAYRFCLYMGPFFVKVGQFLAMRRDLVPDDIARQLARLQDRVPAFPGEKAVSMLEASYGQPLGEVFAQFEQEAVASASIAQVHRAVLPDGEEVAVKLLRPDVRRSVRLNLRLLRLLARLVACSPRLRWHLRPLELVEEYGDIITREMNLRAEAANASQLRRLSEGRDTLRIPEVYWAYVRDDVVVYEFVRGARIDDIAALHAVETDMKWLAEAGVELFVKQVFYDRFFHADMHAGNLLVDIESPSHPHYIAMDFGIVGSLSKEDCRYLAGNFLAFFERDYARIAQLHVDSGWVPPETDVLAFERDIRTVCEPIMSLPLKEMSMGMLFVQLFRVARRHRMRVQPQLVLLQKTILNVEAIAQRLYPSLDLWATAQPALEAWLKQQVGWQAWRDQWREHGQAWPEQWTALPGLLHDWLQAERQAERHMRYYEGRTAQGRGVCGLWFGVAAVVGMLAGAGATWMGLLSWL